MPRLQTIEGVILLPVAEEHCTGGEASNAALTEALQQALKPFLKKPEEGAENGANDEAGQAAGPSNSRGNGPPSSAAAGSDAPPKLFAGITAHALRDR